MADKKKSNFSIRKLIYNDKYLIVCSIIAAIIIWIATSMNLSPLTTKRITVPVSIDFSGTLAEQLGIEYFDSDTITVEVTVSCKKYLAKDINEDDIKASLQTSTVTSAGYHSVPILVSAYNDSAEFSIVSYFPTSAEGYYDVAEEKTFPVNINYTNSGFAAEGYVAGDTALNDNNVTVSGPKTYVSNIDRVVADISLESNLTESQVVKLDPIAVDAAGNKVDYITVNTPEDGLIATVPILKIKNLYPDIDIIDGPEDIENVVNIKYSVDYVEAGVLESSEAVSLDLGDISASELLPGKNEFTFDASKISGITVLDGTEEIVVTITVPDNYTTKTVRFANKEALYNYPNINAMSISSNEVTIVGDEDVLENIESSDLSFSITSVDGKEITSDTDECYITVSVKDLKSCWAYKNKYTAKIKQSAQ